MAAVEPLSPARLRLAHEIVAERQQLASCAIEHHCKHMVDAAQIYEAVRRTGLAAQHMASTQRNVRMCACLPQAEELRPQRTKEAIEYAETKEE